MPRWTDEQLEAINRSGQNIIVSAGAGSGKTAVLTERVITKLKSGIHINQLLILTFTKAAAAEMKERIRKSIKKENLLEELNYIDSSYITTFDSFSLSMVKKYHYLLNLDDDIGIAQASLIDIKRKEIMDEVFEENYQAGDSKFLNMIDTFCSKDDTSLRESILNISKKLELKYDLDEYLNNYLNSAFDDKIISSYIKEYLNIIEQKKNEISDLTDDLIRMVDEKYSIKVGDYISPILEETDLVNLSYKLESTFPTLPRGSEDEVKKTKEYLVAALNELKSLVSYGDLEEIKNNIMGSRETVEVIVNILKTYYKRLLEYKLSNKLYEFNDIANFAIKILQDNEEIREEVKHSFKEIMVDEYQDTNDIQELFIGMIADNNVYMVGDVKQSIYRFRNANPDIFRDKYNSYQKNEGGMKIDLLKNFRSRREVLFDINYIFNQIMSNDIGGAEYSESHQMVFGNTAYEEAGLTEQSYKSSILEYQLDGREYSKDEAEAFIIAKDIKDKVNGKRIIFDMANQLQRPCTYNDFVILMDRATSFDLYKKIFEYLEIPLTLYKDESLSNSEDIYLIRNMLDFLIEIEHNRLGVNFKYDYISIARSFLYELNDDFIFDTFTDNKFSETDIYNQFKMISSNIKNKSVYDILNDILDITNFYDKMITVGDVSKRQIRIVKILELALDLGNNGYDIYQFKEYLDKLLEEEYDIKYSLNTSADNTVKIMTIHKSKGLEYPVCYYSGLSKTFNISDLKDKFLYSKRYGFIAPYFNEGIRENILKLLMKENYIAEEISEKIRLFYVALTRAKEQMILLLPKGDLDNGQPRLIDTCVRKKYRSLADIMYSIRGEIQNQIVEVDLNNVSLSKNYLYKKDASKLEVLDNEKIEVEELNINIQEKEQQHYSKTIHKLITEDIDNNIKLGLQMHEVLEYVDFKEPHLELIEDSFIRDNVAKLLNHNILKNIERAKIYKEFEFIYEDDNITHHGVIDCMIEYDNYIDIIDYKLKNTNDEAYLKQLNGYADYIKNKTNKDVNIYLYSIIDGELKELDY